MKVGKSEYRFFFCKQCHDVCQTCDPSGKGFKPSGDSFEDRCPAGSGGSGNKDAHYFCHYIELVPKAPVKKPSRFKIRHAV